MLVSAARHSHRSPGPTGVFASATELPCKLRLTEQSLHLLYETLWAAPANASSAQEHLVPETAVAKQLDGSTSHRSALLIPGTQEGPRKVFIMLIPEEVAV